METSALEYNEDDLASVVFLAAEAAIISALKDHGR